MGHLPQLKLSVLAHNKQKPLKDYKHMLSPQKFFNNVSADKARTPVRFIIGLATGLVGIADMLSAIVPKLNWDIQGQRPLLPLQSHQEGEQNTKDRRNASRCWRKECSGFRGVEHGPSP